MKLDCKKHWFELLLATLAVLSIPIAVLGYLGNTKILESIYFLGSFYCHQLPYRSFLIKGIQLPICARCTGINLGFLFGLFAIYSSKDYKSKNLNTKLLILLVLPLLLDGILLALPGAWSSNFHVRTLTGFPFGIALAYAFTTLIRRQDGPPVPSTKGLIISAIPMVPLFFLTTMLLHPHPLGLFGDLFFWAMAMSIPFICVVIAASLLYIIHNHIIKQHSINSFLGKEKTKTENPRTAA